MKNNTFFAKQNSVVRILLLVMTIWMFWFLGSAVVGQVKDLFVESQEITSVTMEHIETGYGMITGTEYIIAAQNDGDVDQLIAEGERVRKGNAVFRAGDNYHYTNHAGRVSYRVDGLEAIADISAISELDFEKYYTEQKKKKQKTVDAVSGEPYAKVQETMDAMVLYLMVNNDNYTASLETGQVITVRLGDIDAVVSGQVAEILNTADGERCIKLEIGTVNADLFQQRFYQVILPYNSEKVLTIPKQALVQKRGTDGVYYLHKGFVFWKEVTVSDRWLEQGVYVVETGLKAGDIVVTTPKLVREGENIKF